MNIRKKVLIVSIISFVIMLLCICNDCYAKSYEKDGYGYDEKSEMEYKILNDGTAAVTWCNKIKSTDTLNVPATVNGRKVTQIGEGFSAYHGYEYAKNIKKVILPNTIKEIGNYGFSDCVELKEINIPKSVEKIGEGAFYDNRALKTIDLSNVKIISRHAFYGCSGLTDVKLSKVESIGDGAFLWCSSLKDVQLVSSAIKEIGPEVFSYCSELEKINIPKSVEKIGESAFLHNKSLKIIDLSNVKIISRYAFNDCSSLTVVKLGKVESIGDYAFWYCKSLEKIYLSPSINVLDTDWIMFDGEPTTLTSGEQLRHAAAENITIYGIEGSSAEKYAEAKKINFVPIVFLDVFEEDWFYNPVMLSYHYGFIKGIDKTHYAPKDKLTRGMLVTILWRMEGEPNTNLNKFPDVKSSDWYYQAVNWAASNGIVHGYQTGKFGPKDNITREQLAAILMNYAKFRGKDVSARANNISKFSDFNKTSSVFKDAVSWCIANKIISGKENGTKIDPKGTATRAEAAAMLISWLNVN